MKLFIYSTVVAAVYFIWAYEQLNCNFHTWQRTRSPGDSISSSLWFFNKLIYKYLYKVVYQIIYSWYSNPQASKDFLTCSRRFSIASWTLSYAATILLSNSFWSLLVLKISYTSSPNYIRVYGSIRNCPKVCKCM